MHNQICQHCDNSFNQNDMHPCGESSIWFCHGCWLILNKNMSQQPTSTFVKSKSGIIYQVILHDNKPGRVLLRNKNKYIETSLISIKQGIVNGTWIEINEHEQKAWVKQDDIYMQSLTRKLLKRVIISQLLLELDEDLMEDFKDDKRMNSVLSRSTKECERVCAEQYNKLYNIDKTFLQNFINQVDQFTSTCSTFEVHEFIFLNKMVEDYISNPEKFQPKKVEMTVIQE